ncbi:MAG: GNAT family N-acetyltransferase [Solirubrobacteraceae bacterium]
MVDDLGQPIGEPLPGWQPRPYPPGTVLTGRYCRLEPLVTRHVPSLHRALNLRDPSGRQWTYMPWGPFRDADEFAALVDALVAEPGILTLTIIDLRTGRPEGMAGWARIDPAIGSIEVRGIIYSPELQRTPAATEAMYLMASHVFDDLGYRRYEWKCDALNARSMAAARRLGFIYEGTWRNAMIYKGRNRDTAWFAMTGRDWAVRGRVISDWLDPGNFGSDGQQRSALSDLTVRCSASR